ncbi:MAG: type II toxin-antitoxin system ParD family antitoxin [Alphaproteobacteria bacterium]
MPTRNVVLTAQQAAMVEALVASGRYQNASEVLRDGLRLIADREAAQAEKLNLLRSAIHEGIADIESGRFEEFASVDDLRDHLMRLAEETLDGPKR